MGDTGPDTAQKQTAWPSIDHAKPNEEGGPIARTGFNYQDEIAVGFLIEMLETPALLKVHCETHDDVVLIRQSEASPKRVVEYVQVKASGQDKLWSVVDLCKRKKAKAGTSIFEISLGRDKHDEASIFRLVTLRPVVRALEPLTHPFTARSCLSSSEGLKALCTEFDRRFPGITSPKGNGASFWVDNCLWDQRHSEEAVRKDNLIRLIKLGAKEGRPRLMVEPAEVLLLELRAMAKAAGDAKWDPDRDKKIILRETLRAWWQQRTYELTEGAAATSGGKLAVKMGDAGLQAATRTGRRNGAHDPLQRRSGPTRGRHQRLPQRDQSSASRRVAAQRRHHQRHEVKLHV